MKAKREYADLTLTQFKRQIRKLARKMRAMKGRQMNLGDKVKDQVTGFTGIVIARTTFLHGCVRCGVQSDKLKDGKPMESQWIDEPQLTLVAAAAVKEGAHGAGGPCPAIPQRAPDARR